MFPVMNQEGNSKWEALNGLSVKLTGIQKLRQVPFLPPLLQAVSWDPTIPLREESGSQATTRC